MRVRQVLVALGCGLALLAAASPATADPRPGPNHDLLAISCDQGLGNVTLVTNTNENQTWVPGLVMGSNVVVVPYEFRITGTFTPTGGDPQSFTEESARKPPRNGRLATCTWQQELTFPDGSVVIDGLAKVSYTPGR